MVGSWPGAKAANVPAQAILTCCWHAIAVHRGPLALPCRAVGALRPGCCRRWWQPDLVPPCHAVPMPRIKHSMAATMRQSSAAQMMECWAPEGWGGRHGSVSGRQTADSPAIAVCRQLPRVPSPPSFLSQAGSQRAEGSSRPSPALVVRRGGGCINHQREDTAKEG